MNRLRDDHIKGTSHRKTKSDLVGDYYTADHYYSKDIDLLNKLGVENQIPLVMCKQGDARIRAGLTEVNIERVSSGIEICVESENLSKNLNGKSQFFQQKGQIKGWLGCGISR